MKFTLIAISLSASMTLASPLNRRVIETNIDWFTVTFTVTNERPTLIQTAWGGGNESWGSWRGASSGSPATSVTTTQAPALTSSAALPSPPPLSSATPSLLSSTFSTASSALALSNYAQSILNQHNNHRQNASTPSLIWDDNMASIAQTIGESCVYAHNT